MDDTMPVPPPLRQRIEEAYIHELRSAGHPPLSVFRFCQTLGISEREFFSEYPSLEAVETHWWRSFLNGVITSVEIGTEWKSFSARQRLLAFLFAFTEASLDHRTLFLLRVSGSPLKPLPHWAAFDERFEAFAKSLLSLGRETGEVVSRGPLSAAYPRAMRLLLRSVVAFHLQDDSPKFERTDAYIEKSVNLFFDLVGHQVIDSGFDLLRFFMPGARHRA